MQAMTLRKYMQDKTLNSAEFIRLALELCDLVGNLHRQNLFPNELTPDCIEISLMEGKTHVAGLKTPEEGNARAPFLSYPEYMSPEQSGRMNRQVDRRSDIYSLGIVYYEMMTGGLPFRACDPEEWAYAHLALSPFPPEQINPRIEPVLSRLILKMLAKNVEDRYQSTYGLKADLQICRQQLQQNGCITSFTLGEGDMRSSFLLPRKLYGREEESRVLQAAWERVRRGGTELLLLAGQAGTGKTALAFSLKPSVQEHGYFTYGKFDQVKHDIPYSALTQAFSDLVRQLLAGGKESCERWKAILNKNLVDSAAIIDLIPILKQLTGTPGEIPELSPQESRNRFELALKNFVKVIATPEHPLVIFLDDLQWADEASLQLVERLTAVKNGQCLLFLGAYRDDEVEKGHFLLDSLNRIRTAGTYLKELTVGPLNLETIMQLLSDCVYIDKAQCCSLSEILYRKTDGNPLFLLELLQIARNDNLLRFEESKASWALDLNAIDKYPDSENIILLMTGRIKKLQADTRALLSRVACIGSRFELKLVAVCEQKKPEEIRRELDEAVQTGLIVAYSQENDNTEEYRFFHDRIQQAAYNLLNLEEKKALHLQIGRMILQTTGLTDLDNNISQITDHLNLGQELITIPAQRLDLAGYNLQAGRKARKSGAWAASLDYLRNGTELLPSDSWEKDYQLSYDLYLERAQSEYLNINFETAEKLFNLVLAHARSALERADIYSLKMVLNGNRGKRQEAVAMGIKGLRELGLRLPPAPGPLTVMKELFVLRLQIGRRDLNELQDLPVMNNRQMLKALELFNALIPCASITRPLLFVLTLLKMARISIKYGNNRFAPMAFCGYGIITGVIFGNYSLLQRMQKISLALGEKYPDDTQLCTINYAVGEFLSQWHEPAPKGVEYLSKAYDYGLRCGNIFFNGTVLARIVQKQFIIGCDLNEIQTKIPDYLEFEHWANFKIMQAYLSTCKQFILNLQGLTTSPLSFSSGEYDENKVADFIRTENAGPIILGYLLLKMQSLYLQHAYSQAFNVMQEAHPKKKMVKGLLIYAELTFYESMIISKVLVQLPTRKYKHYFRELQRNLKKMRTWARYAPENFTSRALLMQAEIYRLQGKNWEALNCYDRAINSARENRCRPNEAIGNEQAARFLLKQGLKETARPYLGQARKIFLDWGADACAHLLEQEFPDILINPNMPTSMPNKDVNISSHDENNKISDRLDLHTIIKSSQVITGEVDLKQLLSKLMQFLIENAGAQKAFLFMTEENRLVLQAQSDARGIKILCNINLEETEGLSRNIVEFVNRTGECLVLGDAFREGMFTNDDYIRNNKVKSVLCLPILNQGQLTGVLYLENNLSFNAFSPQRVEVLTLLSTQMAISLAKARLFMRLKDSRDQISRLNQALEQRVQERTLAWEQVNQELRLSEERYRNIFENTGTAMLLITEDGFVALANSRVEELFGYDREQIRGKMWRELVVPSDMDEISNKYLSFKSDCRQSSIVVEGQAKDASGNVHDISVTVSLVPGDNSIIASLADITDNKRMEELMKHMAYHDILTDLPNRALFHDRLEQAIIHARRENNLMAVMMLDLNDFKAINDNFGHQAGDQVLCEVARRLRRAVRESDTVARIGGDEFTLLFPDLKCRQDLNTIVDKVQAGFQEPVVAGKRKISIQCSLGVSLYPDSAVDPDEIMRKADQAMYQDKARARSRAEAKT